MIEFNAYFYDLINERVDAYFHKSNKTYHNFVPLSNYVTVKGGKRIPKEKDFSEQETDFLYLRLSDIVDFEKIDYTKFKHIDNDVYQILKRYEIVENDLAISIAGTIGRVILLKNTPQKKKIILTENCALLALKDKEVLVEYLRIVLELPLVQEQISRNRIQTTIPKIGLDRISRLQIPQIPPKKIQQQIVDLHSRTVEEKQAKEQEANALFAGIDDYLLSELGIELPKDAKNERFFEVNIEDVIGKRLDPFYNQKYFENILSAINKSKYETQLLSKIILSYKKGIEVGSNEYIMEGIPFVRVADINDFLVNTENADKKISRQKFDALKQDYQPKVGEILYSKDGTIGLSVVVEQESNYIISGGIMRIICNSSVNNYFLKHTLSTKLYKELANRVSIGAVIKHLNINKWLKILIPLPPIEKQNEIAEHIQSIRAKAKQLQEEAREILAKTKIEIEKMIIQ